MSIVEQSPEVVAPSDDFTGASLASLLSSQVSSDELIDTHDVTNIHEIIVEGREEAEQLSGLSYDPDLVSPQNNVTLAPLNMWSIICKGAVNFFLPFINGMMLGFGEILAHEIGFRYGYVGARVYPTRRYSTKEKSKFF